MASSLSVPLRHPGRWVAATVLTIALGGTLWSFAKNQNVSWPTVGTFLFNGLILHGIVVTLYLTVVAMVIGVIGGTLVATMRTSKNPIVSSIAKAYVWFFRGTPILIQIIFWGYFGAIYPRIALGIPFTHVTWFSEQSSSLITATMAAILSLGMNEIAYSSEIVRGGINGVTTRANRSGVLTWSDASSDDPQGRAAASHANHHPTDGQRGSHHA